MFRSASDFPTSVGPLPHVITRTTNNVCFAEHFPPLEGLRMLKTDLWDEAKNTRILAWAKPAAGRSPS